jgi:hypothetical protein
MAVIVFTRFFVDVHGLRATAPPDWAGPSAHASPQAIPVAREVADAREFHGGGDKLVERWPAE